MADILMQMAELENCIRTFDRIDSEHGNKNSNAMEIFKKISEASAQLREEEKKKINKER
ncbi:hypothetical protein HDR58_09580 [bacterium]|nr:hypothetical protein [bacterium]